MSVVNKLKKKAGNFKVTLRRTKYAGYYKHLKINQHVILYDAYFGRGFICNPYALFMELLNDKDFSDYTHVWVLDSNLGSNPFASYKNVITVKRHGKEHLKYLASAGYLITNVSMPYYYAKKTGQIYINTWHGTPLKSLGYDIPDSAATISNVLRNFLSADYMISASPFLTSIYKDKYKLDGLFEGKIIEEGYPRNDRMFCVDYDTVINRLSSFGISVNRNKKIILYAPTWKGSDYYNPEIDAGEFETFKKTLEAIIDTTKYQILIKPHQVVYKTLKAAGKQMDMFIPAEMDTNELLSVTDILVSDYSSIFYDFLSHDKPVLFYIPDLEKYKEDRGIYLKPSELPGPAYTTLEEVGSAVNQIDDIVSQYADQYKAAKEFACPYDDGQVSKRIIDIVFKGQTVDASGRPYRILDCHSDKRKILFFGGGLRLNGISNALKNTLQFIDYDKYDVTVFGANLKLEESKKMICSLPADVRPFARIDYTPATFTEQFRSNLLRVFGFHFPLMKKIYPKKMYDREYIRCFGESKFDTVIDYSGYGSFYSILLLSAEGSKKLIWQHNDLKFDQHRNIHGKKPHKRELRVVFSTYPYYDYLVACSEDVMKVNLEKLGYDDLKDKCTYVRNTANTIRMNECTKTRLQIEEADALGISDIFNSSLISFVNMGRLSPEKNQKELIRAFAKINHDYPNTRLYILGDGPLRGDLESLISECDLQGQVFLTGNVENPFTIMKECDCFVLPSLYEGQPVSILEARMLSLPIVMSTFNSYLSAIIPDGQILVDTNAESIYEGMKSFLENGAPNYQFDADTYNNETMAQLEKIL